MSQVYQRGSLRKVKRAKGQEVWEWRYREQGKMKQQMFQVADFPTKKDVLKHLEGAVKVLNLVAGKTLPGSVTMGTLADRYIKECLSDLAKSTRDTWEGVIKLHIKPHWDKVPAMAVKAMAVDKWIKGLPLSASSKGRARRLLKQLIDKAMYWELIPTMTNPVKLVKVKGVTKREKQIVLLTLEQALTLIEALKEPYSVMVMISSCLGLRIEETSALQWDDLDFEKKAVTIQRAWTHGELRDVKTAASEAALPIAPELEEVLLAYREQATSRWLFPASRGDTPRWTGILWQHHIQPVVEKLGLPHIGWHTFRHSYRTWIGSGKATVSEQMGMMRHSSPAQTLAYGGTPMEEMRPLVGAVAARLKRPHPTTP
jgi:integrase